MRTKEDLLGEANYNLDNNRDRSIDSNRQVLLTFEVLIDIRDILKDSLGGIENRSSELCNPIARS